MTSNIEPAHKFMMKKNSAAIKVLIADDHAIVREGLKQICSNTKDIVVVGNAENGVEAVKLCRLGLSDVVLLDIILPTATASTSSSRSKRNAEAAGTDAVDPS